MPQVPDTGLPIEAVVDQVWRALDGPGLGVLTAEPGAGKTTVIPLRLLDQPWLGPDDRILVLEPRRVAARAVARRMASMLGEPVGATVGWRTRDDHKISSQTRIEVVTEGILTRRLQRDPSLPGVAAVLFDEFHERSIHADLGLALTLEARETIRENLRILVMSATIDATAVAALIGSNDSPAPVIECEGRTFPVDVKWQPMAKKDRLEQSVVIAVKQALTSPGDVLVFLPGIGEIRRTVEALHRAIEPAVRPLYGALSAEEQDEALREIPGQRRVVVATDVAETSLTVEGIGAVVDSGLARRPRYDPATGLSKLVTVSNSKASADQRAGRAGRLGPGVAIRLWSKVEHAARPRHEQPEIAQIDLAPLLLESLAWGVQDPMSLRLLDPPSQAAVDDARAVLELLGAVDEDGRITDDGRKMLSLPVHPRLAAMVAGAGDGPMGWPAAIMASLLTERDVIGGRPSERPVDLWTRVQLVADSDRRVPNADGNAIQTVRRRARELNRRTGAIESQIHPGDLGRTLSMAYPDRIAQKRRGQGGRFRLRNSMGGEIDKADPMAHEDMLVVAELTGSKRNARIAKAAAIDPLDVELGFSEEMSQRTFFGWDDSKNDLTMRIERRLGALDFGTHEQRISPSPQVTEALIDHIVSTKLRVLRWPDSARALQARAALISEHRSDAGIAPIDDATLIADAESLFAPWLDGATGRSDLEKLDLVTLLRNHLGWEATSLIDRLAPTSYQLPSGRNATIDYLAESPRVSVRAQDAYGISSAPTIVEGAVPLTFELLSPANRPIQITSDLAAFWTGSWSEVRKDMAGRYPKHDWPTDPSAGR
ncbi:MAG: ATP-dependent helicase HrpB [Acidimicrobiales bacterium]